MLSQPKATLPETLVSGTRFARLLVQSCTTSPKALTPVRIEFVRFLGYARRSATEVQSQLYVAADQGYISQEQFDRIYDLAGQCKKLINGFINYLRHNPTPKRLVAFSRAILNPD